MKQGHRPSLGVVNRGKASCSHADGLEKANQHFLWNTEIANRSWIVPLRKECRYCPKQQNPCSQEEHQLGVET